MTPYEYRVVYGKPLGTVLMPWASQKVRDEIGVGSFERKLNELGKEGWDLVSCSTTSAGSFLWHIPVATAVLRRETDTRVDDGLPNA